MSLSLLIGSFSGMGIAQSLDRAKDRHHMDTPNTHNMLVIGEKSVYLSHLPMFQEDVQPPMPHRYQAILEVTFTKTDNSPQPLLQYVKDRQAHQTTKIYTLNPEQFVLPALSPTDSQQQPLRTFKGKLFRGHLEKTDSETILPNVQVNVKNLILFREFNPKAEKPSQLEYILFGRGEELFLAHAIAKAPDFDQILAVKVPDRTFTNEELNKGIQVVLPGTTNVPASRLKEKQQIAGEIKINNSQASQKIQVEVERELYFEEGELRVPPIFEQTPEEKLAGFP